MAGKRQPLDYVLGRLAERRAYIAAAVVRLGHLRFTDAVETAAIAAHGADVMLFFNPMFYDRLQVEELQAVLIHEAFHFVFRHQQRSAQIRSNSDRRLFYYSCEAVINDIIATYFPDLRLPGRPISGMKLVGQATQTMSAEQVMQLLKKKLEATPAAELELAKLELSDDHSPWEPAEESADKLLQKGWTDDSSAAAGHVLAENAHADGYGSTALGQGRLFEHKRARCDLQKFLRESCRPPVRYRTDWSQPNRKAMSIYPDVVLPNYEPDDTKRQFNVLVGIDASGSVPAHFIATAMSIARQPIPGSTIRLISFDVRPYEVRPKAKSVRGGGGTRVEAAEDYIRDRMDGYPDQVIVFTDGFTPTFRPRHPGRWVWILPPWGSDKALPRGSRAEFFRPS